MVFHSLLHGPPPRLASLPLGLSVVRECRGQRLLRPALQCQSLTVARSDTICVDALMPTHKAPVTITVWCHSFVHNASALQRFVVQFECYIYLNIMVVPREYIMLKCRFIRYMFSTY